MGDRPCFSSPAVSLQPLPCRCQHFYPTLHAALPPSQQVLLAVLAATKAPHEPTREAAFVAIRALAERHAQHFVQPLEVALQPLLMGCADSSREVLQAAHQALDELAAAMPPAQVGAGGWGAPRQGCADCAVRVQAPWVGVRLGSVAGIAGLWERR